MWRYIEQPENQNRRCELMGLAKPGKTRGLTGTDPGSARQEAVPWVWCWFRHWTELFAGSSPGLLAGYLESLLPLDTSITLADILIGEFNLPGGCMYIIPYMLEGSTFQVPTFRQSSCGSSFVTTRGVFQCNYHTSAKKWNWFPKMDHTHRSFSTFSRNTPSNLFAIFHHALKHWMMLLRYHNISKTCLVI